MEKKEKMIHIYEWLFTKEALENMIKYDEFLKECEWEIDNTRKENLFVYGMETYPL